MDTRFTPHNMHLTDVELFAQHDPHLQVLRGQTYIYEAPLIHEIPRDIPGIYTVCGGRQIGKTTLMKQWMLSLLRSGVEPQRIAFLSGELINDHHALYKLVSNQLDEMPNDKIRYFIIDEITYISDWDKGIKYLAETGLIRDVVLILTGSDIVILQEARMRFPGRRGKADKVNFHLYSLSFHDFLQLTGRLPTLAMRNDITPDAIALLYTVFKEYLIHGGYLTAINEYAKTGAISIATLDTYSEWIRGDMLKRGHSKHYLQEIIGAIFKRYNSQVSWINLAQDLSIDHPITVSNYIATLVSMDAVFVQQALLEDKLVAAPKKHKKVMFTDPFIYHALNFWIHPSDNPFQDQIIPSIENAELCSKLVESVVATHLQRKYPTFYIKAEGEVDVAYVKDKKFWPIEVKWTKQLRHNELKQIRKYPNARIFAIVNRITTTMDISTIPIPLAMLDLEEY
ncbi:MAG: ATP-binding protein [Pseudomonadota bacterium]|nr:ATP-binding protein [Pseudomonadota bacterium]